jgi:hypothetical protein
VGAAASIPLAELQKIRRFEPRLTAFRDAHSFARPTQGGFMRFILMTIVALAASAGMACAADDVAATSSTAFVTAARPSTRIVARMNRMRPPWVGRAKL